MTNLLIRNGSVLTMDSTGAIHAPGWVWVDGERIAAVGAGSPPVNLATRAEHVIDASHMAVLPGDANVLLPFDVLEMATVSGARLFGRDDMGHIAPGAAADITLVNLDNARCMPVHRPDSALVFNASGPDVHTVIVAGQILLDAGRVVLLDEAALLEECRLAAQNLLRRAGVEI